MPRAAVVSFRLGGTDGVAVVARSWISILTDLGFEVRTVAGEGPVDVTIPELALGATGAPDRGAVDEALTGVDLVVVENLLTIPLRPEASRVVADVLRGRPTILHHHDPAWQREHLAHLTELPPRDEAWEHVVINRLTQAQFAERGIPSHLVHNAFEPDRGGDRSLGRQVAQVADDAVLALHPVRAIPRKNVPAALGICELLPATYWLLGGAEDGYDDELRRLLAGTTAVHRQGGDLSVDDAYAASDLVLFPSTWEGFGNPPIEAALHRRPVVVGRYPVADELRGYGFSWFDVEDIDGIRAAVRDGSEVVERNAEIARRHFSPAVVREALIDLLQSRGWMP